MLKCRYRHCTNTIERAGIIVYQNREFKEGDRFLALSSFEVGEKDQPSAGNNLCLFPPPRIPIYINVSAIRALEWKVSKQVSKLQCPPRSWIKKQKIAFSPAHDPQGLGGPCPLKKNLYITPLPAPYLRNPPRSSPPLSPPSITSSILFHF